MNTQKGFTLIELMIVIAIIGILAAIALPAYQTYTQKAKFTEVVLAASSVKSAVDICYQTRGAGDPDAIDTADGACATDENAGVDLDGAKAGTHVSDVTYAEGVITATGNTATVGTETYILNAATSTSNGSLIWNVDAYSTCIAAGLC